MNIGIRLSQPITRALRVNANVGKRGVTPSVTLRLPGAGGPRVTVNSRGRISVSDNPFRGHSGS